jgi:hypothetical protein
MPTSSNQLNAPNVTVMKSQPTNSLYMQQSITNFPQEELDQKI